MGSGRGVVDEGQKQWDWLRRQIPGWYLYVEGTEPSPGAWELTPMDL